MSNIKGNNDAKKINDMDKITSVINDLDVLESFIKLLTDYIDFEEFDKGKDKTENILLTYFDLQNNQHNMLNICYESISKIESIAKSLKDFNNR